MTAADVAMDVAIEALTRDGAPWGPYYDRAADALRTLRDRLKEEEEFRDLNMACFDAWGRGEYSEASKLWDDARGSYRRLVALRAVSKEPPGDDK